MSIQVNNIAVSIDGKQSEQFHIELYGSKFTFDTFTLVQNLLQPLYLWGNNLFAAMAERAGSYAFYEKEVWLRVIERTVPPKTVEINQKAFLAGLGE